MPYDEARVSLVSEELTIRLPKDSAGAGMEFEVEAHYTLANRGEPLELLYAVPGNVGPPLEFVFPPHGGKGRLVTPPAPGRVGPVESLKKGPAGPVTVLVGGRTYVCKGKPFDPEGSYVEGHPWCATRLTIPKGDAVPMVLKYRDRLFAEGEESRECPFDNARALGLVYDFHPAGYWAGPVSRLKVRVELGNLDGLERVRGPPGHRKEGSALVWDLEAVDLKTLPLLELAFDGNGRQLRAFAAQSPKRVGPQRPARCLASTGPAQLEVSASLGPKLSGNQGDPLVADELCGLVVTLDPASPSRPRKLRLGPCGEQVPPGQEPYEVELPASDTAPIYFLKASQSLQGWPSCWSFCELFGSTVEVPRAALVARGKSAACVRLELVGPDAGETPCMTGVVPLRLSDGYR